MIKEAHCSYEVSRLLKEKGFNEKCRGGYHSEFDDNDNSIVMLEEWTAQPYNNDFMDEGFLCSAPTLQMAMAWLRKHGFHINAVISYDYSVDADGNEVDRWTFWLFEILSSFSGNLIYTEEINQYESYEEAVEAALKYSLENLI